MVVFSACRVPSLTIDRDSDSATQRDTEAPTARSTARRTSSLTSLPPPPCAKAGPTRPRSNKKSATPPSDRRRSEDLPLVSAAAVLLPGEERVAEDVRLQLQLVEPVLDDVADTDDARQVSAGDDRQMTHPV